jgi:FixJ family two-component response regulator
MADTTVFVVSDDLAICDSLSELIVSAGLHAETFPSLEGWLEAAAPRKPRGCLLLDTRDWEMSCAERSTNLTAVFGRLPVLLLIDRGDVPTAVRAIKAGAADVLEKPVREENLLKRIKIAAKWQAGD